MLSDFSLGRAEVINERYFAIKIQGRFE